MSVLDVETIRGEFSGATTVFEGIEAYLRERMDCIAHTLACGSVAPVME
tara:strand:+ start:877 stop:1023 length:147 start_codon:yes stop_codon:yes gene_type:complete